MIFRPYAHQAEEFDRHRADPARALLWQMRTGKTKAAIDCACHLFLSMEIGGVVIVAPNGVHRQWIEQEVPKHEWDEIKLTNRFAWRFSDSENHKKYEDFKIGVDHGFNTIHWLAVNMESIIRPEVLAAIKLFKKKVGRAMIIFDESHHFARPGAKRTARARWLARQFEYRRILTGTESEDSPLQSFSQYELLEREALGYRKYGEFKRRHAIYEQISLGGRVFPKLVGYQNLEELKERKAPYSSVVLRSECEDLPAVQMDRRIAEMIPRQAALWRAVKKKEIEALERAGRFKPLAGGAALVKLQQIEGGFFKRDDNVIENLCGADNPKMLILSDEIQQYDGQVLVWFQYIHELEAAHEALRELKISHGMFYGGHAGREKELLAFQKFRVKVLLAQPMAGGEGRSMPAGKMLWYSATPSARIRRQAGERATIMGGKSVQMVDITVPGGVCDKFIALTERKTELADDMSREGLKILQSLEV